MRCYSRMSLSVHMVHMNMCARERRLEAGVVCRPQLMSTLFSETLSFTESGVTIVGRFAGQ